MAIPVEKTAHELANYQLLEQFVSIFLMQMATYNVSLGDISVDSEDSDETLLKKAELHLPQSLQLLGEKAGLESWKTMEEEFRGSILELDSSPRAKSEFIKDIARQFVENASPDEKGDLLNTIFAQLKEARDKAE